MSELRLLFDKPSSDYTLRLQSAGAVLVPPRPPAPLKSVFTYSVNDIEAAIFIARGLVDRCVVLLMAAGLVFAVATPIRH